MKPEFEHAKLTVRLLHQFSKRRNWKGLKGWETQLLASAEKVLDIQKIVDKKCPDCGYFGMYHDRVAEVCLKCDYILCSG